MNESSLPSPSLRSRNRTLPSPSELLTELQAYGMRWVDPAGPGLSRAGGAGPSDHKAVALAGQTVMVPILNHASAASPFEARVDPLAVAGSDGRATAGAVLYRNGARVARLSFPATPRFYALSTEDGVPYWQIATLHSHDVLATTVLQHCVRYGNRATSCQFCAIGQSLDAKKTIARKTPEQLARVAEAAVRLDGVQHMVLTTGTPPTPDRGARVLADSAEAISRAVSIPMQGQCEPPADFGWFRRLHDAGIATLGMHLEAVTEPVRQKIMPGKSEVSLDTYYDAFESAVAVFGRGQVTTYVLAGLGDPADDIVRAAERLVACGVYPFVVPFVPITGTPLEQHRTPDPSFMKSLLDRVSRVIESGGLRSGDIAAGCGRCGACSTLRARETA